MCAPSPLLFRQPFLDKLAAKPCFVGGPLARLLCRDQLIWLRGELCSQEAWQSHESMTTCQDGLLCPITPERGPFIGLIKVVIRPHSASWWALSEGVLKCSETLQDRNYGDHSCKDYGLLLRTSLGPLSRNLSCHKQGCMVSTIIATCCRLLVNIQLQSATWNQRHHVAATDDFRLSNATYYAIHNRSVSDALFLGGRGRGGGGCFKGFEPGGYKTL